MVLHNRVSLLALRQEGDVYSWEESGRIWTKAEPQNKAIFFSKIGVSSKTVVFFMYRRKITLAHALRWNDTHYVIADIQPDGVYLKVTAAQVRLVRCKAEIEAEPVLDEWNRPVPQKPKTLFFPGYLTEKYLGFAQKEPYAETETTYVLVTPKAIALKPGDLVQIGEVFYSVKIVHNLDGYKNEYEIHRKEDV